MTYTKQLTLALLLSIPCLNYAQNPINEQYKAGVIQKIKVLIEANYVFVDKVAHINNAIDSINNSGRYDAFTDYESFAKALTDDLVAISKDKHFVVQYNPDLIQGRKEEQKRAAEMAAETTDQNEEDTAEEEAIDWNLWFGQHYNFLWSKVEILKGNVGYIKVNFFDRQHLVGPIIDAAMNFVSNTGALIIDLTEHGGGYSPTDSYWGSYFFEDKPQLWMSSYDRTTDETSTISTFEKVEGTPYLNKPVYILVGKKSFSLAEQFAYCMKHFGKAVIVGETTSGAAHAIDLPYLDDHLAIQVPIMYSYHPVTKTDWEGVGVIPDIDASKEEVIKVAHLAAIEQLLSDTTHERIKNRYTKVKAELIDQKVK